MDNIFRFGRYEADKDRRQLRYDNRRIKLERIPLDLLFLLLEEEGRLVIRERIVERLWGSDLVLDSERSINTAIRKIRRALHDDARHPQFIETVVGKGYRFLSCPSQASGSSKFAEARLHPEPANTQSSRVEWEISLSSFAIDYRDGMSVVSCEIVRGGRVVGRLPLVTLALPHGMTLPLRSEDKLLMRLLGLKTAITTEMAQALQAFCIEFLQNGPAEPLTQNSTQLEPRTERLQLEAPGPNQSFSSERSESSGAVR